MQWKNHLGVKIRSREPKKPVKVNVKIPHKSKEPLARKRTLFKHHLFTLLLNQSKKNFHAAKPLAFSFHFLFRRDQNQFNLTSKRLQDKS